MIRRGHDTGRGERRGQAPEVPSGSSSVARRAKEEAREAVPVPGRLAGQRRGDTKADAAAEARPASRRRSSKRPPSREYHVPTVSAGGGI